MGYRINSVFFEGNLTSDPKYNTTKSSNALVVNFRLANSRKYKTLKDGVKEETCFVNVVGWLKIAKICQSRNLKKGDLVFVIGRLQNRLWQIPSGEKRNSMEVVVESIRIENKDKYVQNDDIEEVEVDVEEDIKEEDG